MWIIKWFLAVVVVLVIMGFALQNNSQIVNIVFVKDIWQYQNIQLWMVIYVSFALGVLFWLVVSVFQVLELKSEVRGLLRTQNELQSELDNLRNLPIGEDDSEFNIKEEA